MPKPDTVFLCSCEGSMQVDSESVANALGDVRIEVARALCTDELARAEKHAEDADGTTLIACGQMAGLFETLWEEAGRDVPLLTVDIRDRAGWTADGSATAKQTALLAEAALTAPPTPVRDVVSEGTCLILGPPEPAMALSRQLADQLAVTCILTERPDLSVPETGFDIALGHLGRASGAIGRFDVTIEGYRAQTFGGRGDVRFGEPMTEASAGCDIIVDLRGDGPLFPADHKRDGYIRVDPGDTAALAGLAPRVLELQGTFEKPLYIRYQADICAHERAGKAGCSKCLNVCPTGAIVADGDHVSIDPMICAGCGACAAVCPSGAARYDDPPVEFLFSRLRTLAQTYKRSGGTAPRALFHDAYGAEMIALSARHGRGLPADVIPVEVPNVEGVGHAEILAALAVGFVSATVLAGPRTDMTVPDTELALARALAGVSADDIHLIRPGDPDALEEVLFGARASDKTIRSMLPSGGRREVTRLAAAALHDGKIAAPLPLPDGAPYGAIAIDTEACTLCLACVSLCPVGALTDNPDKPQVRFQETACLQCGICASTCPETAITLVPQLNLSKDAVVSQPLHEEEPFACIECNKPFGVKSTIERIVDKLQGKHWMYTNSDNVRLIQMCDDCRVKAQHGLENAPMQMGQRPAVRTTEDYLKDRKPN